MVLAAREMKREAYSRLLASFFARPLLQKSTETLASQAIQGGASFTGTYCPLRYLEWTESLCASQVTLVLWKYVQLKASKLCFITGIFHSASHGLTGFNNRSIASSLSALYQSKNFIQETELAIGTVLFFVFFL